MRHSPLPRVPFAILIATVLVLPALITAHPRGAVAPTSVDLFRYVRVGRFNLPEPTHSPAPVNSGLAQEASAVTYNWDTDTLFVVGDSGTSVVQVTKTGALIDSMTLAQGSSSQGTEFFDTEGLTYVGGGKFVLIEERDRQVSLFTYVAGGTLQRADVQTVKLGTSIGNVGLEGLTYDPFTDGFILVKEKDPQSIFLTGIDFNAGTATNGSPTATSSTDLFSPVLANLSDFSDVFALSNLPSMAGQPEFNNLLLLSQESGQILNISRTGVVSSRLTIVADPGSPLSVTDMTMEGVTMDRDGVLYVVNENGGGDPTHPQLWVYAPSDAPNQAPSAVNLQNTVFSIPENTSTAVPIKLADIVLTDDGIGNNVLSLSGTDAGTFQIIGAGLFLKAGTTLNRVVKPTYFVTVNVDDASVGATPDASTNYSLDISEATPGIATLIVSEVAAWSSGSSSLSSDWFEVTNIGTAPQNMTGWKFDDDSSSFGAALALTGIASIAPGESVIFIENGSAAKAALFRTIWFGANPPPIQIGAYGSIGLSTGGDQVNLFEPTGATTGDKRSGVTFGASTPVPLLKTFDNAAGLNYNGTSNPTITTLSATGVNGAFSVQDTVGTNTFTLVGSPGTIGAPSTPVVTIAATDDAATETPGDTGTFRISRTGSTVGALTANFTISGTASASDYAPSLTGVATIPAGQAFVDIIITPADDVAFELAETLTLTLFDTGSSDIGDPSVATVTITDNDPPDTFLGDSPATMTAVRNASFTFTGSDPQPAIKGFECSLDGATFAACTSPVQFNGLAEGTHTFLMRAVGNSGPADATPASFEWIVDLTPPTVTVGASPNSLWPANGKRVPVAISGAVADALSGIDTVTYRVIDEYGAIQPSGAVTPGPGGQYSFQIDLEARRLGQDKNGREYRVIVTATDKVGHQASAATVIIVPHDRGQ